MDARVHLLDFDAAPSFSFYANFFLIGYPLPTSGVKKKKTTGGEGGGEGEGRKRQLVAFFL